MKKMAMVVVCVMMLSTMAIVNDAAATTINPDWYNCTIQSTGALGTTFYFVFATCAGVGGGGSWADSRVFLIDSSAAGPGKALLAGLLTGYASGGQAALYIPGFTAVTTGPPAASAVVGVGAGSVS